jgi:hypothetical protein
MRHGFLTQGCIDPYIPRSRSHWDCHLVPLTALLAPTLGYPCSSCYRLAIWAMCYKACTHCKAFVQAHHAVSSACCHLQRPEPHLNGGRKLSRVMTLHTTWHSPAGLPGTTQETTPAGTLLAAPQPVSSAPHTYTGCCFLSLAVDSRLCRDFPPAMGCDVT